MRLLSLIMLNGLTFLISAQETIPALPGGTLHYRGITVEMREAEFRFSPDDLFAERRKNEDADRALLPNTPSGEPDTGDDDALQKETDATETGITLLSSWEGLRSKYLRSDNNIAVGPDHVVQMINSALYSSYIRVWNKAGDLLINKAEMYSLTGEPDFGDPNIIYDEKADRYVITFLYGNEARLIILASVTPDPTGAWHYYDFETSGGFPDYEKLAVWGDSYIITTAQANPNVYALNRPDILNGIGASPVLRFPVPKLKNIGWQAVSPVMETGSMALPEGEPAVVWRVVDNWWHPPYSAIDKLELFSISIDWDDPFAASMSGPASIPISAYNSNLCGVNANTCLEQPGTTVRLWPLSNFITDKSKYLHFGDHQSIVGVHVCRATAEGTAGQRWYELRKYPGGSWTLYQEGTYSPTADHRFIGSISINDAGAIALGYNITSSSVYPGMRMTGRGTCDPLNTLPAPETIGMAGTAANKDLDYGDYNSLVTDPVDGSFWFTAQYNISDKWSTRVVHFTVDGCMEEKEVEAGAEDLSPITLFPSPATDQFTIRVRDSNSGTGTFRIFNANGGLVLQGTVHFEDALREIIVDCSTWSPGVYFVQVQSGAIQSHQSVQVTQ